MNHRTTMAAAAIASAFAAPALAQDGPTLELPGADATSESASADTTWGLTEQRMAGPENRTTVGGYGEVHYNLFMPEEGDNYGEIDVHRIIVFLAHRFTERLSTYAEIEVEHAFVAGGDTPGEVAIEQAFVDWQVHDRIGLQAGVVLVPMGIINEWHEPPVFHGVERPMVDRVVLPSTWREAGLTLYGEAAPGITWRLAVLSGLDASGFSAGSGLRGGRQHVAEATVNAPAFVGRVEFEPALGAVVGVAGYYGNAGRNIADADIDVPVVGGEVDARVRRAGFEAKLVAAYFSVGNTDELRALEGEPDMGSGIFGAYAELAYDVLHPLEHDHELLPFFRYERYDTTFALDDDSLAGERGATDLVFGLSYRPHPSVVFKQDLILRRPDEGQNLTVFDLGVGWMF